MTREEREDAIVFFEEVAKKEVDNAKYSKLAIEALKQEPAQVELVGDGYADGQIVYDWGKCPNCGWEFEEGDKDWEEAYCCHCGQKLKWFES